MALDGAVLLQPLAGFPLVEPGDDIASLILGSLHATGTTLSDGDIVVIAQKVVSKAEGRYVDLNTVSPSSKAINLARTADKDARLIELVLAESTEVLRVRPGVIIVEHRLGMVLANAGIDRSNVGGDLVLLLPLDPDKSASIIRTKLRKQTGAEIGVLIIDSIGRAWRKGTIGTTIGASGLPTLVGLQGRPDLFGRPLETTEVGWADELSSAASLVMGQAAEGRPVVIVRGVRLPGDGAAADLLRPKAMDLFR